jgi:ectoine hydroxylase-related dioxygenase (phytanoyl-CoA dioxygenase family)
VLSDLQVKEFRATGHLTVPDVLTPDQVSTALDDIHHWGDEFLENLADDQKRWYLEPGGQGTALRKLDNPAFHRQTFQQLAKSDNVVAMVEQLIGPGVSVFFSQIFCKPPEIGGPKPIHQDNFYFGPDDLNATLTVWIALDTATVQNGCLFYGDSSNLGPIHPHIAPKGEPFNLQLSPERHHEYAMTPAPVQSGGISFHHGNTWHQSSANTSDHARRAVAFHYLQKDARLVQPALDYDASVLLPVT